MSKQSTSRLTPSRKNRSRYQPALPDAGWLDAMEEHCFRLDMLAELLLACGEPLADEVVKHIGLWLNQEVRALQMLRDQFGKETR